MDVVAAGPYTQRMEVHESCVSLTAARRPGIMMICLQKLRRLAGRLFHRITRRRLPMPRAVGETATVGGASTASPVTAARPDGMRPALAAVHASVASAVGDHAAFRGFVVHRAGHLVEVSVEVGLARRRFIVDPREANFAQRLQAKLQSAFPHAVA
jgi:hypothetical protein